MKGHLYSMLCTIIFLLATGIVAIGLAVVATVILPGLWAQQAWEDRREKVKQ
jgi:hypothetical protein